MVQLQLLTCCTSKGLLSLVQVGDIFSDRLFPKIDLYIPFKKLPRHRLQRTIDRVVTEKESIFMYFNYPVSYVLRWVSDMYNQFLRYFYCKMTLLDIESKSFSLPGFTADLYYYWCSIHRALCGCIISPRSCLVSFYKLTSIVYMSAKTLSQIHFIKMQLN